MTTHPPQFRFKVCLLGDAGVGKTSLVNRVASGVFDERYLTTVGLRVEALRMQVDDRDIELGLWDLAGGMENRALVRSGYSGAEGVLVVTDPTRPSGLSAALEYLQWMHDLQADALCWLLFNKADLRIAWLPENFPELGRNVTSFITSAKSGEGVEEAFRAMARALLLKNVTEYSAAGHA
jgi:small GTP-binding protein